MEREEEGEEGAGRHEHACFLVGVVSGGSFLSRSSIMEQKKKKAYMA